MKGRSFFFVLIGTLTCFGTLLAEETVPMHQLPPQVPLQAPPLEEAPETNMRKPPVKKGRRVREKEAEGSQAPNRFEADTVIKSKYLINGEPLEVDPD